MGAGKFSQVWGREAMMNAKCFKITDQSSGVTRADAEFGARGPEAGICL